MEAAAAAPPILIDTEVSPTPQSSLSSPSSSSRLHNSLTRMSPTTAAEFSSTSPCFDEQESPRQIHRKSFESLSAEHQQLIKRFFTHYVGPKDMSAGAGLGLARFRRFLRDCG